MPTNAAEPRKGTRSGLAKGRGIALLTAALVAVGAMAATGVGLDLNGSEKRTEPLAPPIELRLGLSLQPASALMIIALENGYLREEGLDVTVTEFPSGKRAMREGLFTGAVDAVTVAAAALAAAAVERRDFRIVTSVFSSDNVNRIVARRDSGISRPQDLRGKRVGTQRASAVHFFLYLFSLTSGIVQEDIRLSFMKADDLPRALADGRLDAFSMREPYVSQAKTLLGENAIVFEDPGLYRQSEQVVIAPALTEAAPEAVDALLRALVKAEDFAREERSAAIQLLSAYLDVEEGQITELWPKTSPILALDESLLSLLEVQTRWLVRSKLVSGTPDWDFAALVDARALKKTMPARVTLTKPVFARLKGGTADPTSASAERSEPKGG